MFMAQRAFERGKLVLEGHFQNKVHDWPSPAEWLAEIIFPISSMIPVKGMVCAIGCLAFGCVVFLSIRDHRLF
jgi:hypothetical protein